MDLNANLNVLLNILLKHYFFNEYCLFSITDSGNEISFSNKIYVPKVNIHIKEKLSPELVFHSFGCQLFVIKVNKPLSVFKQCEILIKYNTMERFNNRKYVFLPGNEMKENFRDIAKLNELNFVSDLLLIMEPLKSKNKESIYLRTHKYVGTSYHNKLILLDKWFTGNESFWRGRKLFPNKLKNQKGRTLRLSTFTYEPFSILADSVKNYLGSELLTIMEFCKHVNMNTTIVETEQYNWGHVYPNFTGYGLLGDVAMDKSDIAFDALWTYSEYYPYLDLSTPLIRSGVVCLVPAPKLASGWATPLYSFSFYMWMCIICLYIIASATSFAIRIFYLKNNFLIRSLRISRYYRQQLTSKIFFNSFFVMGKLIIIQTLTKYEIPKGRVGKILTGIMFIASIFLTTSYSSGLASIMTIPRYDNPIDTVEEFLNSDLKWGTTDRAWITSIEDTDNPHYQKIVAKFYNASKEQLREDSLKVESAFGLERLPNEQFSIGSYIKSDVIEKYHVMKSDLYWEESFIYTRKSFILLPLLDRFILRVHQAGLLQKWQSDAVLKSMDATVQKSVVYHYHNSPKRLIIKLTFKHVEGAFALLMFGLTLSFLIFVLEIILEKFNF